MSAVAVSTELAILYGRVSTDNQAKAGYSAGKEGFQFEQGRAHCAVRGYTITGEVTDVDSGANWDLPGMDDVLERARRREFTVLVVYDTYRFARDMAKHVVIEAQLRKYGVRVDFLNLPDIDGPLRDFISNTMANIAQLERNTIARRTSSGRHQKAKSGKVVGAGSCPYGYRYVSEWSAARGRGIPYTLEPDEQTAPIVRRIYAEIMTTSAADLAADLTADGIAPPRGPLKYERHAWCPSTVRRIVKSAVYHGEYRYGESTIALDQPIVDATVWHAAQARLVERQKVRRGRKRGERSFPLRGRLTCGHCGGALATVENMVRGISGDAWKGGKQRRYVCLRSIPHRARQYGWTLCPSSKLLAADERTATSRSTQTLVGIEDLAWTMLREIFDDERTFRKALANLTTENVEARREWGERLAIIDREIAEHVERMERAASEKLRFRPTDARYRIYDKAEAEAADALERLETARERYAGAGGPGYTPEQIAAAEQTYAACRALIATGLDVMTVEERAAVFEALDVRAVVTNGGEQDTRVGRDSRVVIEWSTLLHSGASFLKIGLLLRSSGLEIITLAM